MLGVDITEFLARHAHLRADIVAALGLILAVAVTVHVLLRKRDVESAIGWIGLAWFSPIVGGLIYMVFGINRVQRLARKLRERPRRRRARRAKTAKGDGHLTSLRHAGGRITHRPAEAGNSIEVFHNGDAAYPLMLAAIEGAQSSVGLSSYIFRNDVAGRQFIAALSAARKRGVAVRVILDGIGSGYFISGAFRALRRERVPVGRFMHSALPWRMPFLNLRSHKKILVVDGTIGFTGGINVAIENLVATNPPHPVRDTHFRVLGPVVAQLTEAFARDWAFVMDEELEGNAWYPALAEAGPATARVVTSGPDQDLEKIEFVVLQAIACARERIHVMTPYFLPDERLITALALAAMRGVAVDIVVPSKSDHFAVNMAMHANIGPLLKDGCRMWRSPIPFNHSKIMVVDGEWCLVGSSNWDMRSFRLNFELNVEVYDAQLAGVLVEAMKVEMGSRILPEQLEARSLPIRLRDAGVRLALPYL